MQLRVERDSSLDDLHVLITYVEPDQMLGRLVCAIKNLGEKIEAHDEDRTVMLNVVDIYYFESVDKRTFAYCKHEVYRVSERLYQIKEKLARAGCVQVNKACLLNVNMLESIRSTPNSKMEAELSNGERVSVSRKYLPEIKAAIKR
jgi:DNA-binding LytR/AlgR family response regulator